METIKIQAKKPRNHFVPQMMKRKAGRHLCKKREAKNNGFE
mgnify:CR=1 FL=1